MTAPAGSTARAWLGTFVTGGVILACGVATGIIVARRLGPADRGVLAELMFWPQLLASIGFCSLDEAIIYRARRPGVDPGAFAVMAATMALGLAALAALIGAIGLPLVLGGERRAWLGTGQAYLVTFLPLNFVSLALLGLDRAAQRFGRYNRIRLVPSCTYLAGLLTLLALGRLSVATALWAAWLGSLLTALVRVVLWRGALRSTPRPAEGKALMGVALRFHGAVLAGILGSQADRAAVLALFDDRTLGMYVVAWTFAATGLGLITQTVGTVLYPRLVAEADPGAAAAALAVALQRTVLVLLALSATAFLAAPLALPLLFGQAYAPAVPLALALILAYVPLALRQIITRCLRVFNEVRHGIVAETLTLVTFLVLVWPAARLFGAVGIGLALGGANLAGLIHLGRVLDRAFAIPWSGWLRPRWATVIGLAAGVRRLALPS